jgi:hypothetical protein
LSASPNPAAFGNVGVGANASITVNLTNNGMVALVPSVGINRSGRGAVRVRHQRQHRQPAVREHHVPPGGRVLRVVLWFAPTAAGAKSGSLIVGLTSAGTPIITVPLTGTGVNPTFSATPNPLNLGGVGLGGSSSGIVTITNTSSFATAPPALSISGTNAGQFTIVATTNTGNPPCATTASLPAGGACTTSVRFHAGVGRREDRDAQHRPQRRAGDDCLAHRHGRLAGRGAGLGPGAAAPRRFGESRGPFGPARDSYELSEISGWLTCRCRCGYRSRVALALPACDGSIGNHHASGSGGGPSDPGIIDQGGNTTARAAARSRDSRHHRDGHALAPPARPRRRRVSSG